MASYEPSKELSKESGERASAQQFEVSDSGSSRTTQRLRGADDALLAKLGYKSEFRREFSVGFSIDN